MAKKNSMNLLNSKIGRLVQVGLLYSHVFNNVGSTECGAMAERISGCNQLSKSPN